MTTPKIGLPELTANQEQPHIPVNTAFRRLDILTQLVVKTMNLLAPPGSPAAGDAHIVAGEGGTATGAWAGKENQIAFDNSGWQFIVPKPGWVAYVEEEGGRFEFTEGSPDEWLSYAITAPFEMQIICSDLATDLTTGDRKAVVRVPHAFTCTAVRASLATASSSGAPTVDVNKNGATILSTPITVDTGELTSVSADTPPVISGGTTVFADDDEVSIDVDDAGADVRGLVVTLIGYR